MNDNDLKICTSYRNFLFRKLDGSEDRIKKSIADLADSVSDLVPVSAFEVYAHDADIPIGYCAELCKTGDTISEAIPACMGEHFILSSLQPKTDSDVSVDWGDGVVDAISDLQDSRIYVLLSTGAVKQLSAVGSSDVIVAYRYHMLHMYSAGKYIIKITGKAYSSIQPCTVSASEYAQSGYGNLMSRVLAPDLPIAAHITNYSGLCHQANRLLYIDVSGSNFNVFCRHGDSMFYQCRNLIEAVGFNASANAWTRASNVFTGCGAMVKTDFKFPARMTGDGPNMFFNGCKNLVADVAGFFPDGFTPSDAPRAIATFYNCPKLTGTVPAKYLWDSGANWTLGAAGQLPFLFCSAAIRAQVPVSWGGTAPDSIIKPKLTGLEILHPVSVTGGTVILNAARNAYTVTPAAATSITIDASGLGEVAGAVFTLIVDLSAGVQTVTFPEDFSFVGGTAPVMSRKGYYFIRTTFSGLGEGGFFGEYIGVTQPPKDLTKGVWYYDVSGELDDSVYSGEEYVSEATITGGTFLVNSGAVVGELNTVEDYENPGAAVSRCIIAGTVGVVNANPGVVSVLGGTIGTLYGSDVTITAGKVGSLESPLDYDAAFLLQGGVVDHVSLMWNTSGFSMTGGTVVNLFVEDYRDASVIGGTVVSAYESTTGTVLTVGGTATVGTVTLSDQSADWLTGSGLDISGDALVQRVVDEYAIYDDSPVKTGISISGGTVCIAPGLAAKITAGQVALNITGGTVVYLDN